MPPRVLVYVLGLCNVVAGALLASGPAVLVPIDGVHSAAAVLLARSGGILLGAIGLGAWCMPPAAVRRYLWLFGVAVKVAGALVWGMAATTLGVTALWLGAAVDLGVALVVATGLRASPR